MILKERIKRILYFKLLQIRSLLNNKKNSYNFKLSGKVYILLPNGAGDVLMSLSAIRFLFSKYNKKIIFLYCRNEAGTLLELYYDKNLIKNYLLFDSFENNDLVIALSGPPPGLITKLISCNCNYHGFVYDLKIRSNITNNKSIDLVEFNHIRRNNCVVESLFNLKNRLSDLIPPPLINVKKNKLTKMRRNNNIAIYLPQNKIRKAFPKDKIIFLIGELSKKYEVNLISYEKELFDSEFINNIKVQIKIWSNWNDLITLLQDYDSIITVDSVVYHLCNSLNLNFIALFGWTSSFALKTSNSKANHIDYSNPANPCYSGCLNSSRKGERPKCSCLEKGNNSPCSIFNLITVKEIVEAMNTQFMR
tara:strand:+ start:59 stop:1147 length:1089 start_codon:yes stop_codon:yes gene_type:complete